MSDGLTPHQVKKLNYNFSNLFMSLVEMANADIQSVQSVTVGDVITLPPGSPATVRNVGSKKNLLLEFGIPQGEEGNGIEDVEQTQSSTAPGGINVITFTMSDGTRYTIQIRNGTGVADNVDPIPISVIDGLEI